MLVLSRKVKEGQNKIRIGGGITVHLLRVDGGSVRLGISAPADVTIVRGELPDRDPVEDPQPEPAPAVA